MTDYVIIVAGGKGLRMGSFIPKQFLPLGGKPVLMRTIETFHSYSEQLKIIVALPHDHQAYWNRLCDEYQFEVKHQLVDGGETRFHSVRNALSLIGNNERGCIAVHDGVRPFVSRETIERCFVKARESGAAIPVVPVIETLRHVDGRTMPRSDYRLVQTPQVFDIKMLKRAYKVDYSDIFTDDSTVVEYAGIRVMTVEGNRENIKITTPLDIIMGEAIAKKFDTEAQ